MIIMAWEGSLFVWVLAVCTSVFAGLLHGNSGCLWEGSSTYAWLSSQGAHMLTTWLLCGGKDHNQSCRDLSDSD